MQEVVDDTELGTSKMPPRWIVFLFVEKQALLKILTGEDHSIFSAFAPKENPQIALAVYVENGGWGSTWAVPIGSLMIEEYLTGGIKRVELEKHIMEGVIEYPRMRLKKNIFDHVDWWLIVDVCCLSTYWLAKHLCCHVSRRFRDCSTSVKKYGKQLQWIIIASVIAMVILFFNWHFFEGFAYIIYFIVILALIGVLFLGIEVNGAKSMVMI